MKQMLYFNVNSGLRYNSYFVMFLHPGLKWYWIKKKKFNSEFFNVENISLKLCHFSAVSLGGEDPVWEIKID